VTQTKLITGSIFIKDFSIEGPLEHGWTSVNLRMEELIINLGKERQLKTQCIKRLQPHHVTIGTKEIY
jgi:hypothetical protein